MTIEMSSFGTSRVSIQRWLGFVSGFGFVPLDIVRFRVPQVVLRGHGSGSGMLLRCDAVLERRMTLGRRSLAFRVTIFRRIYGCPISWRWRKRRWDQNGHSGSTPTAFVSIASVFGRRSLAFEQDNFGRRCRVRGVGDRANFGWRTFRLSDGRSGE